MLKLLVQLLFELAGKPIFKRFVMGSLLVGRNGLRCAIGGYIIFFSSVRYVRHPRSDAIQRCDLLIGIFLFSCTALVYVLLYFL